MDLKVFPVFDHVIICCHFHCCLTHCFACLLKGGDVLFLHIGAGHRLLLCWLKLQLCLGCLERLNILGIQWPPGFLFERLSLSLFVLNNCKFKN